MRLRLTKLFKYLEVCFFSCFLAYGLANCSSSEGENDIKTIDQGTLKDHGSSNQRLDTETLPILDQSVDLLLSDLKVTYSDHKVVPVEDSNVPPMPDKAVNLPDKAIPDLPKPDLGDPCLRAASPECWDISAIFFKTDFELYPVEALGQVVADGQKVYGYLDGTKDDTYTTPGYICLPYYSTPKPQPLTWDIERIPIDEKTYKILVRGRSDQDCDKGQALNSGEVEINMARGWKITETIKCQITDDSDKQGPAHPAFCIVRSHKISWQSGTTCGGCCNCPDGANVNIEVIATKE